MFRTDRVGNLDYEEYLHSKVGERSRATKAKNNKERIKKKLLISESDREEDFIPVCREDTHRSTKQGSN